MLPLFPVLLVLALQPPASILHAPDSLSLADVIRTALERNAQVAVSRHELAAADERTRAAATPRAAAPNAAPPTTRHRRPSVLFAGARPQGVVSALGV